jgi:hypothetical protein
MGEVIQFLSDKIVVVYKVDKLCNIVDILFRSQVSGIA